ncbi:ABC transporter substrate-binding protein [Pseudofrankia inefficax]|uniref:Extracellular solute-binding protein family 1 n=1 Tax=Pseudofrankia inefficax (strain DSM 45817 / CECT 9037 / DDB 130130 / EuI1c) TaxID=298654 RepID=E3IY93_PSEI1|nr:ABC transporter substrate-binding protein [Pseudofrankia inefficax]ADP82691.1 extracellular solute-binding protein family 1 [Pseudofrankia inefficax]
MARPRLARAAAGLALLSCLAAACATGGTTTTGTAAGATSRAGATIPELTADQKVSITFESYNLANTGTWKPVIEGLIADFEKQYPNITVKAQPPTSATAGDFVGSIKTEALAGNPPDVAQITFNALDFAATALAAKPLDSLVGTDAVKANFAGTHPFAPAATTLGDLNGHTYTMPYVFSTPVLWINASLFKAAGLDPTKPPTTWDEVRTDALAIKQKAGKDGVYLDCTTKGAGDWCFQSLVRSNGGQVISADRKSLTFDQPAAVGAVSMAADLYKSGATPNFSQAQAMDAFTKGDLGMMLETSALQGAFIAGAQAGHWDLTAAAEPGFGTAPAVPTNSGSGLSIFSNDPAKQRAGWDLIKFLTSDHAYTEISSKIGYLPLRTSLVDDPAYLKPWADQHPLIKPNLDQLTRLKPWVSFPGNGYQQITDLMMSAAESAIYQGKDPKTTLADAARQGDKLLPAS